MKAFRIDPINKKITEVKYDGNYKQIYDYIDARAFDVATLYENGDGVYIDDEGLFVENQHFWIHKNFPTPLAGIGLLLGLDEEGDSTTPKTTIEELTGDVKWVGDRHDVTVLVRFNPGIEDYRPHYFTE
jgi:hypothetical protein